MGEDQVTKSEMNRVSSIVVKEVTIFEKNKSLMQASGKYNQARLHLGFHYPRSEDTIMQSKSGFALYKKRFPYATKSINKNILCFGKTIIKWKGK